METPSQKHQITDISRSVAGALAWWRDAGLTHGFADNAQPWLAADAPPPAPILAATARPVTAAPTPPAPPAPNRGTWPQDLADFAPWWLAGPLPMPAGARPVPPRGPAGANLMVIVAMPEPEDEAILLSGPRGRCLAAMLSAMAIAPAETYIASALPACDALPDWADLAARGLGDILAHHIALVAPQRICIFGQNILPLLNNGSTQIAADLNIINQKGPANTAGLPPIFGSPDLDLLVQRSAQRRRFWNDWLEWSA